MLKHLDKEYHTLHIYSIILLRLCTMLFFFFYPLLTVFYMYRNGQVMYGNVEKSGRVSLILRCKSPHSFILRVLCYYNHRMNLGPTVIFISEILLFLYLSSLDQ